MALGIVWLVWLISWLLAAGWSSPTKTRESGFAQLKYSAFLWAGGFLIFAHAAKFGLVRNQLYPVSPTQDWGALVLVVIGLGWTWWARIHLGRQWSVAVTLKEGHKLIRTGPYSLTRHPIYTGLLLALLASAFIADTRAAPLGLLLCVIGFVIKVGQEERLMLAAFGDEYVAYQAKVPALVLRPRIKRANR